MPGTAFQQRLQDSRPLIMGILNITPDSFSDGGAFLAPEAALEQARTLLAEGADLLDIGGESTRPGADPVPAAVQLQRVLPVIRALRTHLPAACLLSIDTTRSEVADAALTEGVDIVNDVSAATDDPAMLTLLARRDCPVILMHRQGRDSKTMQDNPRYEQTTTEVRDYLLDRARQAERLGIRPEHIILDPGIGFGKRREDNLELMACLTAIVAPGYPVLLGASRKRFMGAICQEEDPKQLVGATVATTVLGVMQGVRIFRVHDVKPNRQAADVTAQILASGKWRGHPGRGVG